MDKRLILIDGYPIIYRSFYALMRGAKYSTNGINTSIILGFVNTLEMILKDYQPTHIAVVFDSTKKTFRHEAYPEYKAQREASPEDIHKAVPVIKELVSAYNIAQYTVEGYEADDVIGTLAKRAGRDGYEVLMVTPDKDYAQLVDDNVNLLRITQGTGLERMNTNAVCEKWDVSSPSQIIDLLAMMGDASDNVPGCKGVGEKTAVKLLKEYGSVEGVLDNAANIKGALGKKVEESKEQVIFSKFLVTICLDVPVEVDIERDLKLRDRNTDELLKFFKEYEMKSFAAKYAAPKKEPNQLSLFDEIPTDTQDEQKYSILSEINSVNHHYKLIENEQDIVELVAKIEGQTFCCFDTETTSTDVFSASLVGLSFCFTKNEAFFVLLPEDRVEQQKVLEKFRPFFENETIEKIGQNLKFDILMLRQYGIKVKGKMFDTMIAHYLLQPERKHGMDALAEQYLSYKTITYDELTKENKNLRLVDKKLLTDYAAEDADITLQLSEAFRPLIAENKLEHLLYDIEMPLMLVLAEMENNGVRIDSDSLKRSSVVMTDKLLELSQQIYDLAGMEFNISSPRQVGEVLYEKLSIVDKAKKTKTGQLSTSEEVLISLKSKHSIVEKILEYRGIKKLQSTYIDALPQLVNARTGKIHTSFNQTVTATGRLSSSNPNLQNIPIREEMGKEIRRIFIPEEDSVFLSADYSQIELRVMAHASEDPEMIAAFCSDYDFHQETAAKIFKVSAADVTKEQRGKAKTANFGILYGISAFGLSERLGISREESKALIDSYYQTFPRVKSYLDELKERARKDGYVETLFGRRRYIDDINSRNGTVRQVAERTAINAPIQGTAADIIKLAMIEIQRRIDEKGLKSKMIIQVHDELNFTVPKDEVDVMKELVISSMEGVIEMKVPLKVECGVADNWLGAH